MNKIEQYMDALSAKSIKVLSEIAASEIKHFHPEAKPTSLDEAFKIYEEHGRKDYTKDALEVRFCDLIGGLIKGNRFVMMKYAPDDIDPIFMLMEFDDDFENISKVFEDSDVHIVLTRAYGR